MLCFFFINLMMVFKRETRHFNIWLVYTLITSLFVGVAILSYYYLDSTAAVVLLLSGSLIVLILIFYFINITMVSIDLMLYIRNYKFITEGDFVRKI